MPVGIIIAVAAAVSAGAASYGAVKSHDVAKEQEKALKEAQKAAQAQRNAFDAAAEAARRSTMPDKVEEPKVIGTGTTTGTSPQKTSNAQRIDALFQEFTNFKNLFNPIVSSPSTSAVTTTTTTSETDDKKEGGLDQNTLLLVGLGLAVVLALKAK
jgi:type II secretory pathway pseudopilin PulG